MSLIEYYKSLDSIRQTTRLFLENPWALKHFNVDIHKLELVCNSILNLISRDYKTPQDIPPHSRKRHFEASAIPGVKIIDRISPLVQKWESEGIDNLEITRRLLDLFIISVLLDAGAGAAWKYVPKSEPKYSYNRSEGLALASLDWFLVGGLSSSSVQPYQVDSVRLKSLNQQDLMNAFQVSQENPLVGLERISLLVRLGSVCEEFPEFFASKEQGGYYRPGNLLDYLLSHPSTIKNESKTIVDISILWKVMMEGFSGVWPATRTRYQDVSLGDVWHSQALKTISTKVEPKFPEASDLVSFHKLSQWLTYSLMEPLEALGIEFSGIEKMTGLAEYRNGGLFVDMEVLTLKNASLLENGIPKFHVHEDIIIEWRALTIALLDKVGEQVCQKLGMSCMELPLVKVLEAGTWKLGREIAAKKRPLTKGPPIEIISDGTVF